MLASIRLLPITILVAALMFSVKMGDVWLGVSDQISVRMAPAQAQDPAADEQQPTDHPDRATPTDADVARMQMTRSQVPGGLTELEVEDEASVDLGDISEMSAGEIRLLIDLAERRRGMQVRERELDEREALLRAAEQRLMSQQGQLNSIKAEIQALLDQFDAHENDENAKLVKIYSNMKPKNAAAIFNELDTETVVNVMRGMSERKIAPIIAAMNTEMARNVTRELADREPLPEIPN